MSRARTLAGEYVKNRSISSPFYVSKLDAFFQKYLFPTQTPPLKNN
jgi:hypothetical protein